MSLSIIFLQMSKEKILRLEDLTLDSNLDPPIYCRKPLGPLWEPRPACFEIKWQIFQDCQSISSIKGSWPPIIDFFFHSLGLRLFTFGPRPSPKDDPWAQWSWVEGLHGDVAFTWPNPWTRPRKNRQASTLTSRICPICFYTNSCRSCRLSLRLRTGNFHFALWIGQLQGRRGPHPRVGIFSHSASLVACTKLCQSVLCGLQSHDSQSIRRIRSRWP